MLTAIADRNGLPCQKDVIPFRPSPAGARPEHLFVEENIDPTASNPDAAAPAARTRRPRLLWLIAAVFAVVGVVVIGVAALTSRSGPPQPSAAAAGTVEGSQAATIDAVTPGELTSDPSSPAPSGLAGSALPNSPVSAAPSIGSVTSQSAPPATSPAAASQRVAPAKPAVPPKPATRGPLLPSSPPVSMAVPAIGVTSALIDLGLNPDNTVQVPSLDDPDSKAGWYQYSPTPGSLGPAIILGHIDSKKYGPGVFFNLGKLKPGDTVDVTRKDGKVAVFRIDGVRSYPKNNFPTLEVYGNLDHAGLRLITCGGVFDPNKGSYESNIVAFASLVSVRAA